MPGSPIVFFILAFVAVGTAVGMLLSRNTVYSALFLALNFATVAMLYLILGAPFIALSQITVYAGSIMVLFLFVIMLLGVEKMGVSTNLRWLPAVAIPLVIVLVALFAFNLFGEQSELSNVATPAANYGAPASIGEMLFTEFMLPFEITAVILLAAAVGAILLAQRERTQRDRQRRVVVAVQQNPANEPGGLPEQAVSTAQETAQGTD